MWLLLCTYAAVPMFGFIGRVVLPGLVPTWPQQQQQSLAAQETIFADQTTSQINNIREQYALEELRSMTVDLIPEFDYLRKDHLFMRFLKARNMDVSAANQMLRATLKWRMDNQIDSILNETIFEFAVPAHSFLGYDFEGRPVVNFRLVSLDVRRIILGGKRAAFRRFWVQILESILSEVRKISDKNLAHARQSAEMTQAVAILDMAEFSLTRHFCVQCIGLYIDLLKDYENFYPQGVKYFIFINLFRSGAKLLEVFRPTLSPATQRALRIFGPQKSEWEPFLLSIIPPDQLPVRYGGTKIDVGLMLTKS